jgi:uncharacterized protein YndB with AHSA1/START domain
MAACAFGSLYAPSAENFIASKIPGLDVGSRTVQTSSIQTPSQTKPTRARRLAREYNNMSGNTVRLHRVFATKPEKIFRAFLDADAMAKWLPPHGFTCKVHHLDAKVGGTFRMSFTNFTTKSAHSFSGEYLEIVPNERIRYTDKFDDPNLPGVIEVTVTLKAVACGTEINIEQSNLPTVIPVESCYLGWQQSLMQLALLVEPEIPE